MPGGGVSELDVFGYWFLRIAGRTNDAVPEPVGGRGNGNAFGADGQLEDFADDDPACGAPCAVKVDISKDHFVVAVSGQRTYEAKKKMNKHTKTMRT